MEIMKMFKKLMDNFYPESCVCDGAFVVVWTILVANENNSVD